MTYLSVIGVGYIVVAGISCLRPRLTSAGFPLAVRWSKHAIYDAAIGGLYLAVDFSHLYEGVL